MIKSDNKSVQRFLFKFTWTPLIHLFNALNKYNLKSPFQYCSKFIIEEFFHLSDTSEEEVFELTQNIKISKATGIENLSGKPSKDGTEILTEHRSEIPNLPVTPITLPNANHLTNVCLSFLRNKILKGFDESVNYNDINWLLEIISHN